LVEGPHYYVDASGKSTNRPEFVVDRNSKWPQGQELTGTFAYRFYFSYKLKLQTFWPSSDDVFMSNLNTTYKNKVAYQKYWPTRSYDMTSDLQAINSQLKDIEANNSAKILWAKDENAAIAAYNNMLKEFEAAGVDKVYNYYTQKYLENKAAK
jgi:hypothetical protein